MKYRFSFLITFSWCLLVSANVSAQKGKITGKVKDALTGEAIAFANVVLPGTTQGTTTNDQGIYSLEQLDRGFYNITVSFLGYKSKTFFEIQVSDARVALLDVELEADSRALQAVEVQASAFSRTDESPLSLRNIGVAEIQRNPGGNRDISKAIQSLPGVSSGVSFRNDIIIRGGAPNENRFYLDGVEVPVINHFATQGSSGGPVGIINVDMIREVDFYSGAFPANRGNALSSVFEFKQKDARSDKAAFRSIVGASDIGLIAEGPIGSKTTYVLSARRSYLQFLFSAIGLPFLPTFNGFQTKVKHKIDDKNEIYFIGLGAIDQFKLNTSLNLSYDPSINSKIKSRSDTELVDQQRYILGYLPVTTQWNYTNGLVYKHYAQSGVMTFVLSRNMLNNVQYKRLENNEDSVLLQDYVSQESDNRFRFEHQLRSQSGYKLSYGLNLEHSRYYVRNTSKELVADTSNLANPPSLVDRSFESRIRFLRWGIFGQVSRSYFGELLVTSAGLRLDGCNWALTTSNMLEQFSPRLSLSYNFAPRWTFNANTGIYYQLPAYTLLGFRNTAGDLLNRNNGLTYMNNVHWVAGVEYFGGKTFKATLESFYKGYSNVPVLQDKGISLANLGADFGIIGNEPALSVGLGKSYGLELMLQQKLNQGFYGIIALTWVRSFFDNRPLPNSGAIPKLTPSAWDNRSLLTLTGGKIFAKNWEVGVRFRYVGAPPFTPFASASLSKDIWDQFGRATLDYTRLNSQRSGATMQLDVRVDRKWDFRGWALNLYFDIQNALNQQTLGPPFLVAARDRGTGVLLTDPNQPDRYLASELPNTAGQLLPTVGIIVDF
ncbi:MAG: TonB-dependent receptor [Sphingomonadales bacterium]|nr:TonB-dependent receptor [Sphingomonadales bacterium]